MTKVLKCAAIKDLRCLSRYTADPSALRATFPDGKHGWNPELEDALADGMGVNLYGAAVHPKEIAYRVYQLSRKHYDIVFYEPGALPAKATWAQAARFTPSVHCEFQKTSAGWQLTDTVCGYVSGD